MLGINPIIIQENSLISKWWWHYIAVVGQDQSRAKRFVATISENRTKQLTNSNCNSHARSDATSKEDTRIKLTGHHENECWSRTGSGTPAMALKSIVARSWSSNSEKSTNCHTVWTMREAKRWNLFEAQHH